MSRLEGCEIPTTSAESHPIFRRIHEENRLQSLWKSSEQSLLKAGTGEVMTPANLEGDHKLIEEVLDDLLTLLQKQDINRAFELLDLFWTQLAVHIRAENVCLFPAILNAPRESFGRKNGLPPFEEVKALIETLRADHAFFVDQVSQAIRRIRELMALADIPKVGLEPQVNEIKETMLAVADRLRAHSDLEHDKVYAWPELLLPADQYELLLHVVSGEIDKMPRRVERLV